MMKLRKFQFTPLEGPSFNQNLHLHILLLCYILFKKDITGEREE